MLIETMGTTFDDSFWDTDFNGTLGFDRLCKRMRDGQKVCRDIIEFFKKRSKADLQYSKTLRTIAKTADGKEEICSEEQQNLQSFDYFSGLGLSWRSMKAETEKSAQYHENASVQLNRIADDLLRYVDIAKTELKQIEDKVKDRQKVKKTGHSKMTESQKAYIDKCREMKTLEDQLEVGNMSVTSNLKEIEKLKTKADKSREAMEKLDITYKQSVETLEQARVSWEADMEDGCKNFQRLEEERIYFIRDKLWKCTNIDSQLCVDRDGSCENVRQYLETCDVQNEMSFFISMGMTGPARPAQIEYSNYFDPRGKDASQTSHGNAGLTFPSTSSLHRTSPGSPGRSPSPRTPKIKMCFDDDTYAQIE